MNKEFPIVEMNLVPAVSRIYGGQEYIAVEQIPHIKKDGTATTLFCWKSKCHKCGETFIFKQTLGKFSPNRRCSKHARPGSKAKNK